MRLPVHRTPVHRRSRPSAAGGRGTSRLGRMMRQTLRLGRVGGIAVGVHWSVLAIMVLLVEGLAATVLPRSAPGQGWPVYWSVAVAGAVLFLVSLLAHELAHAFV